MNGKQVFVPKPELTIFQDTFLKCEIVKEEKHGEVRLKILSVHTGNGGLLQDLTAEHEDEMITVKNKNVYDSYESMKLDLNERT